MANTQTPCSIKMVLFVLRVAFDQESVSKSIIMMEVKITTKSMNSMFRLAKMSDKAPNKIMTIGPKTPNKTNAE